MLRTLAVLAQVALAFAEDVPLLFTSNDDYDEINLNIRMLANHSSPAGSPAASASALPPPCCALQRTRRRRTLLHRRSSGV